MLWRGRRGSGNVEDRRGMSTGGLVAGGGVLGLIVYLLNAFLGGGDSSQIQLPQAGREMTAEEQAAEDTMAQFVSVVLAETEDTWSAIFSQSGQTYDKPNLVLFRDQVESGCGFASAASGPFYCPADQKLYID